MTAPERRCAPGSLPLSRTAIGTSPRAFGRLGMLRRAVQTGSPPRGRRGLRRRRRRRPRSDRRRGRSARRTPPRAKRRRIFRRAGITAAIARRARSALARSRAGRRPREIAELEDRRGGSLLIATITFAPCMPTLCWIAPEMPIATYTLAERLAGLSDLRRVRIPTGVNGRAGGGHCATEHGRQFLDSANPSAEPSPRPPATMTSASSSEGPASSGRVHELRVRSRFPRGGPTRSPPGRCRRPAASNPPARKKRCQGTTTSPHRRAISVAERRPLPGRRRRGRRDPG